MGENHDKAAANLTWYQRGVWMLLIGAAVLVTGLCVGAWLTDTEFENYDLELGNALVDLRTPSPQAEPTAALPSQPADPTSEQQSVTIFRSGNDETFFVQIPVLEANSASSAVAQPETTTPEATPATRTTNGWIQALLWLLLFGISAFLAYLIYSHLRKSSVEYHTAARDALKRGLLPDLSPIPAGESPKGLDEVIPNKDAEAIEKAAQQVRAAIGELQSQLPAGATLSLKGPMQVEWLGNGDQNLEYKFTLSDGDAGLLQWGIQTGEPDKFVFNGPNIGSDSMKVTVKGPGNFAIWAREENRLGPVWIFSIAVVEVPKPEEPAAGRQSVTIPYVGVGWGSMLLGLFLLLLTAVLALEGVVDSDIVSGVFLGVAGFLFGTAAVTSAKGGGETNGSTPEKKPETPDKPAN